MKRSSFREAMKLFSADRIPKVFTRPHSPAITSTLTTPLSFSDLRHDQPSFHFQSPSQRRFWRPSTTHLQLRWRPPSTRFLPWVGTACPGTHTWARTVRFVRSSTRSREDAGGGFAYAAAILLWNSIEDRRDVLATADPGGLVCLPVSF